MNSKTYRNEASKPIINQFNYETVVLLDGIAKEHQLSKNERLKHCVHEIVKQDGGRLI